MKVYLLTPLQFYFCPKKQVLHISQIFGMMIATCGVAGERTSLKANVC